LIWLIPNIYNNIGFEVTVTSDPDLLPNCCEYNCDSYISRFGGEKIEGCYVLKHSKLELFQLIKHFIVYDGEDYIDVTPFDDLRDKNYFIPVKLNTYNIFIQSLDYINNYTIQETETMYYVYCYIDPVTDKPFYVGKGKQNRANVHMFIPRDKTKNKNKTRFKNKLDKMKEEGVEPKIIFLAQNIQDENIAYQIEESYIKQYGRKGYDENGILLNICEGSRPPNHKGKSYKEIYGDQAEHQRSKRHMKQIEAGGWFKGHTHSPQTKSILSQKTKGNNNPRYGAVVKGTETATKIGLANKGKKHYSRSVLLCLEDHNNNTKKILYQNELRDFCSSNNYSYATFSVQLYKQWPVSKKGKNAGLRIRYANDEEISAYITGSTKQDVTDSSFSRFKL